MKFAADDELFAYNCLDLHATGLAWRKLNSFGADAMSLFDHALNGPALTMGLRGLRVDERAAAEVLEATWDEARRLRRLVDAIQPFAWSRTAIKPSPMELARTLYDRLRAPVQTNRDGGRTCSKEALEVIQNSAKSSEEAATLAGLALELSRLEEDRKVLVKPRGRDGRIHSGLGVAATVTSRWSSRRDAFGEGTNLHALSRRVRRIFIADPGKVLVNRDLAQAESYVVAYLANCQAYKDAHRAGNVHYHVLQKLWPGIVANKREAKDTPVPYNPDMSWYDQAKRIQHACLAPGHEVLTRSGWVPVESIGDAEEIAAWAPGLSLTWEKPSRWTRVLYDGDLVHFFGRNADQRVTPDHRLPMFNNGGLLYERRAETLPLNYGRLPVAGIMANGDEFASSPAWARLVAATWADGNVRKIWTVFSLKKDRKKARLRELLAACGLEFRLWAENNRPGYEYIAIRETLRKRLGWDMLSWSLQARLAFLDELPFWDGSRDRGWRRVFNTDREGMEIIQAIAHISGFRARITKHGNPEPGHKQCWILYVSKASQAEFSKLSVARTPFSGIVHCPTVSTGWFLTRHNGIVSVTGNSNYGQTAVGFARVAHVPVAEAKKSQVMYFAEFPEIPAWHGEVERQLTTFKCLTTPLGRIRHFLGRSWSHDTLKEAIAHVPQSTVSDINKIILWRIWKHLDPWLAEVLLEVHDSVLAQVPEARVNEFLEASGPLAQVEIPVNGDLLVIGSSVGIGRNWGSWSEDNPEGLKE